jgi:excisionase family DNA binding protein
MNQSITTSRHHRGDDGKAVRDIELVNARELAKLLSISERSLYRLKSTGELPAPVVLGGSVRWRLKEIHDWINKGCPRSAKPKNSDVQ